MLKVHMCVYIYTCIYRLDRDKGRDRDGRDRHDRYKGDGDTIIKTMA